MNNNNTRYSTYLQEEYYPAQVWYKNGGAEWIAKYVSNGEWIIRNYSEVGRGIYTITFNDVNTYIGQSRGKLANRLVVHAFHLMKEPERWFGVLPEEIKSKKIQIDIKYIEEGISTNEKLNEKEEAYIRDLKPYLQGQSKVRYNWCIYPKGKRRDITKTMLELE